MFHSHGYVLIIVAILRSAQKQCSYVNSLIAARKQQGRKMRNTPSSVRTYVCQVSASRFLGFGVRTFTHKPTHILLFVRLI
jgi:hypothetical protein